MDSWGWHRVVCLQLHGDGTLFFNAAEAQGCVGVSGPPPTNVKMTGPLGGLVIRQPGSPPANIVQVNGALTIKSKFINIVNRDASFGSYRLEPQYA